MGYTAYLQQLLQPLGVYDLQEDGLSGGELAALGEAMDAVQACAEKMQAEGMPLTAEAQGLSLWESLLPYPPVGADLERRRQQIVGLRYLGGENLTADALSKSISGCGVACRVDEELATKTAVISFPGIYGEPEDFEAKKRVVEGILPCHLALRYAIRWYTWLQTIQRQLRWLDVRDYTFRQWCMGEF